MRCAVMRRDATEEIRAQLIKAHQWSRVGEKGHHLEDLQSLKLLFSSGWSSSVMSLVLVDRSTGEHEAHSAAFTPNTVNPVVSCLFIYKILPAFVVNL